ncbi:unnamed protein product [Blepharisma stoltei]|uniref:Uncharacterized protein n=1 Tax=Blepharisma stoltei TaxID=1481888 RepID=A0AAU9IVI5_9CILI|nr:unnamed protein product [Blepharisma stoltei]
MNAQEWMKKIHISASNLSAWILIGSKCDLAFKREVLFTEGEALARMIGIPFIEISSLENKNIDVAISAIISSIITKINMYY